METSKQQTVVSQNVRNQNDEVEIDLVEIFSLLLSRIWILILITILGAGVAGGYTALFMEPKYQAKSEIFILNTSVELSLADIQVGSQLTQDYIELITSRPVIDKVISELKLDMNYKTFKTNLSVTNPSNTRILYLTITNTDAYMAKTIVDTDVAIDYIAAVMETDRPNVIDYGHIPETKSSPSMAKNVVIGGLLGFILTAAVIIIRFLLDDSIKSSEDIEKYLGLETLGMIPVDGESTKKKHSGSSKGSGHDKKKAS